MDAHLALLAAKNDVMYDYVGPLRTSLIPTQGIFNSILAATAKGAKGARVLSSTHASTIGSS